MTVSHEDILRVTLVWDLPGTVVGNNVFYWKFDDPQADEPTDSAIITSLVTKVSAMVTDIQSHLSTDITADDIEVDKIAWNVDKWEVTENIGEGLIDITGTNTTDAIPHGVAALVTAKTAKPKTRARKFFPGIAENEVTDSTLSSTLLASLANLAAEWLSEVAPSTNSELIPIVISLRSATMKAISTDGSA